MVIIALTRVRHRFGAILSLRVAAGEHPQIFCEFESLRSTHSETDLNAGSRYVQWTPHRA